VIEAGEGPAESSGSSIPATLQDSLTARLDALSLGKAVAQCGAVIGREFSRQLLDQISSLQSADLDAGLVELVESGLITQLGTGSDALFLFRHALVQDAAYATILRDRCRTLHRGVATALKVGDEREDASPPEVIAHHFFYAGDVDSAVSYWQQAGELASSRSAEVEAVAHFQAGLNALSSTTNEESKSKRELDLIVAMIPPLMAIRGYGSNDVKAACERARELCRPLGARQELAKALAAHSLCHQVRGDLAAARSTAHELLALSGDPETPNFALSAHTRLLVVEYFHGDFKTAQRHLSASQQLSDEGAFTDDVAGYNDPTVERLTYAALTWWTVGQIDQATTAIEEALERADELDRPFTLAYVLAGATWFFQRMNDPARTRELAERLLVLCRRYGFRFREAQAQILLAWAHCAQGNRETWIRQLESGIEACRGTGARANFTYYWAILAEQYLGLMNVGGAEEVLTAAFRVADAQEEGHWTVELHRLRGDLARANGSAGSADAIRHYRQAIALAQRQQAKTLELRSVLKLYRMLQQSPEHQEAKQRLQAVYDSFTQGFDSRELREARALLGASA
jgi:tetratricopeptide (TPR) repeat protein